MPGQDVAAEIVRHAAAHNFTHIVIGKPDKPRWREYLRGLGGTHDLIRRAGNISVHVTSGASRTPALAARREDRARRRASTHGRI
jgi:two-component system sensor histidine kinase KdpD